MQYTSHYVITGLWNLHCAKELKDHTNAETQIFHFADTSVFVLWQPSVYNFTKQNDSVVFFFLSF